MSHPPNFFRSTSRDKLIILYVGELSDLVLKSQNWFTQYFFSDSITLSTFILQMLQAPNSPNLVTQIAKRTVIKNANYWFRRKSYATVLNHCWLQADLTAGSVQTDTVLHTAEKFLTQHIWLITNVYRLYIRVVLNFSSADSRPLIKCTTVCFTT